MPIELIGIITVLMGLLAFVKGPAFALTALLCFMLLGCAAAVLLPGLGTIQPGHLFLLFAALIMVRTQDVFVHFNKCLSVGSAGFWLAASCLLALLLAFFAPRLYTGFFDINSISIADSGNDYSKIPLKPTNGNITQSVYYIADVICFMLFWLFASSADGFRALTRSFIMYGLLNIAFAIWDIAGTAFGLSWTMDFIRNSSYVIFVDSAVGNSKRIIGSFSEASAFAFATLGIAAFFLRAWLGNVHPRISGPIAFISLGLLLLSTSSTAYVAMAPVLVLAAATSIRRSLAGKASTADAALLILTPLVVCSIALVIFAIPQWQVAMHDYLRDILFSKASSASGLERGRLNTDGLEAFFATSGVGAGLGSIRTSSFSIAILANLGAGGALLYAAFLYCVFFGSHRTDDSFEENIRAAARFGCFGILSAAVASGSTTDLGLAFFALAALACASAGLSIDQRATFSPAPRFKAPLPSQCGTSPV